MASFSMFNAVLNFVKLISQQTLEDVVEANVENRLMINVWALSYRISLTDADVEKYSSFPWDRQSAMDFVAFSFVN